MAMFTTLKGFISLVFFTSCCAVTATAQVNIDDPKEQTEAVAKMCRGEFSGIFADNVNEIFINGRKISVEHSKKGITVREVDGALIDGVKYGSASEYVDCLERMIKALGIKAGLTAADFPVILAHDVPCDSRREYEDGDWADEQILRLFSDFVKNDGKIVYVDFFTWIGTGCDLNAELDDIYTENPLNHYRVRYGVGEEPQEYVAFSDEELSFLFHFDFYGIHNQGDEEPDADRIEREKLYAICEDGPWACPTTAAIAFPSTGNLILTFPAQRTLGIKGFVRVFIDGMQGQMAINLLPIDVTERLLLAYEEISGRT